LQGFEVTAFSVPVSQGSVILVIKTSEALPFLGVVDILVLAGSISVMGVNMAPSRIFHTIFAPRSHPTPCIIGAVPKLNSGFLAHDIPQRVKSEAPSNAAIILLRQSKTGVGNLGHVSRAFNDLFGDAKSIASWGISGFYALV
jgi:hypothetical protein